METYREKAVISIENLEKAAIKIKEFAASRKLVVTGEIPTTIPTFESGCKKKKFGKALDWVLTHPTMRNCNAYLRSKTADYSTGKFSTTKLDYSEKEKAIQQARKAWLESKKVAEQCRLKYKEEKGNFYK